MTKIPPKMRIVYDASAKTFDPSLNKCVETGPCLLPKLFDILVRFRSFPYGITSDIQSAFLNIRVDKRDRNYLRFLWLDDINKLQPEIVVKRFTSVLFGMSCSPSLLGSTVLKHMQKFEDINKSLVEKFLRDLYMDDSISGADNLVEGFEFYLIVKILMKEC